MNTTAPRAALILSLFLAGQARAAGALASRAAFSSRIVGQLWRGPDAALPGGLDDYATAAAPLPLTRPLVETALTRVLDQLPLETETLSLSPPERQVEAVWTALRVQAESLLARTDEAEAPADGAESLVLLNEENRRLEDLAIVARAFNTGNSERLLRDLTNAKEKIGRRIAVRGSAMIERAKKTLKDPSVWWQGRTALIPLEDGQVLALKTAPASDSAAAALDREAVMMRRAELFGLDVPIPLKSERGNYARTNPDGTHSMPYLLPQGLAKNFLSYLGDPLAGSPEENRRAVREAARKAVDDMVLLHKQGYAHTSLAPMSHSEARWAWNFWRDAGFFTGLILPAVSVMRHGPTSIHNWNSSLSYANLRLSGMADFEHVASYAELRTSGPGQEDPDLRSMDPRWQTVGQNLTEWALLVSRAGANNGLGVSETVEILHNGFLRHLDGFTNGDRALLVHAGSLRGNLSAFVRNFYRFHRISRLMPGWAAAAANRLVGVFSNRRIPAGESLTMPGIVLQALVVSVVDRYLKVLRGDVGSASESFLFLRVMFLAVSSGVLGTIMAFALRTLPVLLIKPFFLWACTVMAINFLIGLRMDLRPPWVRRSQ